MASAQNFFSRSTRSKRPAANMTNPISAARRAPMNAHLLANTCGMIWMMRPSFSKLDPLVENALKDLPKRRDRRKFCRQNGPVLLVEDDRNIRELETEALRDWGCEVIAAADAQEALERLPEGPLALLVTDIRLPGPLDGIGLACRLKQRLPDLKVLIVGMDVDQLHDGSRQTVADDVLRKPFSLAQLEKSIAELMRS